MSNHYRRFRRTPVGYWTGVGVWDPELQFLFEEADAACGLKSYTWAMIEMIHFGVYSPTDDPDPDLVPRLRRVMERYHQVPVHHQRVLEAWYCRLTFEPDRKLVQEAHEAFERTGTSEEKRKMIRNPEEKKTPFDPRAARLHLANLMRADQRAAKDLRDPCFSLAELSQMTGWTLTTMNKALQKAKVRGVSLKYPHSPTVPFSRIMELAEKHGWSEFRAKEMPRNMDEERPSHCMSETRKRYPKGEFRAKEIT